jgi:hypothetical protein
MPACRVFSMFAGKFLYFNIFIPLQ